MQRFLLILALLLCGSVLMAAAQEGNSTGIVKGRLVAPQTGQPLTDLQLTIPALKQLVNSDPEGKFLFSRVPYGTYLLIVGGNAAKTDTLRIDVHGAIADLGDVTIAQNDTAAAPLGNQIPVIALEENTLSADDDGVRVSNVSGLLSASRDPFISAVAFVFGPYRFQPRGYNRTSQEVQINGAPMNDVESGEAYWGQWGGLNDVFRSRSNTYGLKASEYTFGGINGSVYFDATAANQRKQTRITYNATNRSYRNRLMITHSSGLSKSGWAYSLSASRRWAQEGYIPGTFYDGYSYYAGVSKRISGGKHEFNLITFGAPTKRGTASPVTQETYDLAGSNYYNPNWGYQNGEKRTSRVANSFLPTTVLSYQYAPSNSLRWNTSFGYQFGYNKRSGLDWYNANNPRPDYYRNLPSYYILNNQDPGAALFYKQQQIDWQSLYNQNYINYETIKDVNGVAGNNVTGRRSLYVISDDVEEVKKYIFNTTIEKVLTEHITLHGGLQFISQRTENYRQLTDLLGGDFFLNLNQFAVQQNVPSASFNQYNLDQPNGIVRKGDKYNYDFISRFTKGIVWAQGVATYNKVDFFLALRGGYNDFSREGLYRSGLFPYASFGKSDVQRFTTYSVKGGATYKLDGRNFVFVNAGYSQDAPTIENTFISNRTRNQTVLNPTVEKVSSLEAGYLMRTPKYNIRAVGYATDIKDATEIKRFYNDDVAFQSFVNYVLQGVSSRYTGLELAAEVKVSPVISVGAVAALGQAFYTDNPGSIGIYRDNDTVSVPTAREAYIKNYYVAAGPQTAYTLGIHYGPHKFWNANLNFNYFDRNYIDVNPDRRTVLALEGVQTGSVQYNDILAQEKLPAAFTVDLSVSKSFLLSKFTKAVPRGTLLYLSANVSNLLDSKDVRTGGFEQLRYDFETQNPANFPSKYFYSFGRNFSINVSLKF